MSEKLIGNCLIAQSGGPTTVINSSLAGLIVEALNHDCIEEIYGGLNGIWGILNEELIDLAEESQQVIRGLRYTPGSALGTCRFKLKSVSDYERVLNIFREYNIRYFFYIGGNDSQDTANKIAKLASEKDYEMRIIGVPKTIDNDLPIIDHCPGYGSVIKYAATTVREMACDNEGMGQNDLVSVLEVMGRNTGWIAAGTSLAKRPNHPNDPPHLIYLPETPFSQEKFINDVKKVLKSEKYCFIVVGEGLVDSVGNYVATATQQADAFGHTQLGGAGEYLCQLVENHLKIKARSAKLGIGQRAAAHCSSQKDNDEAYMIGQAVVQAAVNGETDKMGTFVRVESGTSYTCETGLCNLHEVANAVKTVPLEWINEDQTSLNYQFYKYASPLIKGEVKVPFEEGLPQFVKLSKLRCKKRLPPLE